LSQTNQRVRRSRNAPLLALIASRLVLILTVPLHRIIVLVAVKPQALSLLSAELALFCSRHAPKLILSILAGVTIDRLRSLIGAQIPILRAMPNTPALIGEGVTACVASSDISAAQQTQVTQLLSSVGGSGVARDGIATGCGHRLIGFGACLYVSHA